MPCLSGVAQTPQVFPATSNHLTVTGLTGGTSYTSTVAASNVDGTGPASSPTNAVTPT